MILLKRPAQMSTDKVHYASKSFCTELDAQPFFDGIGLEFVRWILEHPTTTDAYSPACLLQGRFVKLLDAIYEPNSAILGILDIH